MAFLNISGLTRFKNNMQTWVTGRFKNNLTTTDSGYALDARQGAQLKVYKKACGTISALPITISDSNITSDMYVLCSEIGVASAQLSNWTVTTATGSFTISGTLSGTTSVTLYFARGR